MYFNRFVALGIAEALSWDEIIISSHNPCFQESIDTIALEHRVDDEKKFIIFRTEVTKNYYLSFHVNKFEEWTYEAKNLDDAKTKAEQTKRDILKFNSGRRLR